MIQPEGPLRPVDWNNVASPTEDEQQMLDIYEAGFSIQLAEEEPAPASETKDKPKTGREKKESEAEAEWKAPPGLERQAREAGEKKMMTRQGTGRQTKGSVPSGHSCRCDQERKFLHQYGMVIEAALAEANDDDGEDEIVGVKAEPEEAEEEEAEEEEGGEGEEGKQGWRAQCVLL